MPFGIDNQLFGGAISTIVGGAVFVDGLLELGKAIDSKAWPRIEGEIEQTGVVSDVFNQAVTFAPVVRYHYRVGDRQYVGDRIAFGGTVSTSFRSLATSVAEKYGGQKSIPVWVSPDNPMTACLEPGVHWSSWIIIAMAAFFLFLGLNNLFAYFGVVSQSWLSF